MRLHKGRLGQSTAFAILSSVLLCLSTTIKADEIYYNIISQSSSTIKSEDDTTIRDTIEVFSFEELEAAVKIPNRVILIDSVLIGKSLTIEHTHNITLMGKNVYSKILSWSGEDWVVNVSNVELVSFKNITFGHTTKNCLEGGVVSLDACKQIEFKNCKLYGSGIIGLRAINSSDIILTSSDIYECTISMVHSYKSNNLTFYSCNLYDNTGYIKLVRSTNINFHSCYFRNNKVDKFMFFCSRSKMITVASSEFHNDKYQYVTNDPNSLTLENTNLELTYNNFESPILTATGAFGINACKRDASLQSESKGLALITNENNRDELRYLPCADQYAEIDPFDYDMELIEPSCALQSGKIHSVLYSKDSIFKEQLLPILKKRTVNDTLYVSIPNGHKYAIVDDEEVLYRDGAPLRNAKLIIDLTDHKISQKVYGIYWMGDLDNDGKLDIIEDTNLDVVIIYSYSLLLSSEADKGKLFKEVASIYRSGC